MADPALFTVPEEERQPRPARARVTWLRTYDRCPRAAHLALKYGDLQSSPEMQRGSALHLHNERLIRTGLEELDEPGRVPPEVSRAILDEVLREVPVPVEQLDGLRMMCHHVADQLVIVPEEIVAVEVRVHLRVGDWTVSMRIDFAWSQGERAGVVDWKSSPNMPDREAWGPAVTDDGKKRVRKFQFQTLTYTLGAVFGHVATPCPECEGTGQRNARRTAERCPECEGGWILEPEPLLPRAQEIEVAEVYPYYSYDDGLGTRSTVIERKDLPEHLDWLKALLVRVDESFDSGVWPATPGSHCSECPARRECPLPESLRGVPQASNETEAAAAASRAIVLAQEQAEINATLRKYGEFGETLIVGDYIWEWKSVKKRSVRQKQGTADWEGLFAALDMALRTGEPFDREFWIRETESTSYSRRKLKPAELVEINRKKEETDAKREHDFGDEAPF